jgi:hypothetical protein
MKFKGKIVEMGETITGQGAKGEWSKTSILVEEINQQYPNSLVFDALNKNIDGLAKGMIVNVEYNAKASQYNGKMYNSLLIYKIESIVKKSTPEREYGLNVPNPSNPIDNIEVNEYDSSNLPF